MTDKATNQQLPPSDGIMRKIQLLLNLGERSEGNETEAAAAMAKAQELLAQYNLDMATVADAVVAGGSNANKSAADVKREKVEAKRNATYEWSRRLVKAVAEANYCVYWAEDVRTESKAGRVRWVKRHRVLGRVENTTAVLVMTDYLYGTIMRLLPYDKSTRLSSDAMAWCDGCVDRLTERVAAKARALRTPDYAAQGEAGYATAIMVRGMAEAEEAANHDAIHGKGAWVKKTAIEAEYERTWPEREARWAAEAKALRDKEAAKLLAETPAEKKQREAKERRERRESEAYSRRYWAREDRREERAEARRSSDAYKSGAATGAAIGLDGQVAGGAKSNGLGA
jgi:hypothetical protein